jgi:hypothetical protein
MNVPLKALASYQSSTIVSPETMTLPRQALLVSCFTSDNDSGKKVSFLMQNSTGSNTGDKAYCIVFVGLSDVVDTGEEFLSCIIDTSEAILNSFIGVLRN